MRKSEIYRLAQYSVLRNDSLGLSQKLEILRELMTAEDLARFSEEQEAKSNEAVGN